MYCTVEQNAEIRAFVGSSDPAAGEILWRNPIMIASASASALSRRIRSAKTMRKLHCRAILLCILHVSQRKVRAAPRGSSRSTRNARKSRRASHVVAGVLRVRFG